MGGGREGIDGDGFDSKALYVCVKFSSNKKNKRIKRGKRSHHKELNAKKAQGAACTLSLFSLLLPQNGRH